jgi:hypothetical protein
MRVLLTFGIRSRIVENLTAVAHAEKKGLKGSRCWVLNLGSATSIFARTFTSIIDYKQAALDLLKDYCKTGYKDVIPDVILENRPPVNIKTQFAMKMLTTGHHSNGEALSDNDKARSTRSSGLTDLVRPNHIHRGYYTTRRASADLTVATTKNFNTFSTIASSDTFHHSGTVTDPSVVFLGRELQQHQES